MSAPFPPRNVASHLYTEHEEALASERRDRAQALLGLPELIAGIECSPLTPKRLEWLRAFSNPFVCGGEKTPIAVLQFLWFVSPEFQVELNPPKRKWYQRKRLSRMESFTMRHLSLDVLKALEGIEIYINRMFLDAPHGSADKAFYAPTAGYYRALNESYPNGEWTLATVCGTPIPVIYQLIKCADKARGCSVINRRSDEIAVKWCAQLETLSAPTLDDLTAIIEAKRTEGYSLMTLPSKSLNGSWACAMQKEERNG